MNHLGLRSTTKDIPYGVFRVFRKLLDKEYVLSKPELLNQREKPNETIQSNAILSH